MIVDVAFCLRAAKGATIPTDHGYAVYSAVTGAVAPLHEPGAPFAIHPVRGFPQPGRLTELDQQSELIIRLDHTLIPLVLPLAGRGLRIGPTTARVGVPSVRPLRPAATVQCRLAVIKGFTESAAFLQAVERQVAAASVRGKVTLVEHTGEARFEGRTAPRDGPVRRTIRIRGKEIVGFAVKVSGLSNEDSIALQARGIGGRQHFGCGVLVPAGEGGQA